MLHNNLFFLCGFSLKVMPQSDANFRRARGIVQARTQFCRMAHLPAIPRDRFYAGRNMFQRFESNHCKRLYQEGWSVYEIIEMYYKRCTLREMIVAIRVGICVGFANWYEALDRQIFNVRNVNFDQWVIGGPFNKPSPRFMSILQGQYKGRL